MILMDVGPWLALTYEGHVHSVAVRSWKARTPDTLVMCRVTQMSLLRLLTNRAVMRNDVQTRAAAWAVLDQLTADAQVTFTTEPDGLEPVWRTFSARDELSHTLWTDDYLAAFALVGGMRLATLDHTVRARYPAVEVLAIR